MDNQTLRDTIAEAIHQGDRKMPRECYQIAGDVMFAYYQIAGDVMFALKHHGYHITKEPTEGGGTDAQGLDMEADIDAVSRAIAPNLRTILVGEHRNREVNISEAWGRIRDRIRAVTRPERQGPVWTQGYPEVSGVYWVRNPQGNNPEVVKLWVGFRIRSAILFLCYFPWELFPLPSPERKIEK